MIWRTDLSCGHVTQLAELRMVGDLIVTSGVDQRLILRRHSRTVRERVSLVGSKRVSVADVSTLNTLTEDKERLVERDEDTTMTNCLFQITKCESR